MSLEILVLILLFIISGLLIYRNFKYSLYILLVLSVFLHKELFSIYRWDLLPIRIFMLAFTVYTVFSVAKSLYRPQGLKNFGLKAKEYLKDPFIFFLVLLWLSRLISLLFSRNLQQSVFLMGFFTTIVILGVFLFKNFKNKPHEILQLIKFYIIVAFSLCLFGIFQFILYYQTGVIIGALWNIPNNLPRIGSTFWDVNHFGALLASLLPVLGVMILISKTWKSRIIYSLMFIPMSGILFLTNSRTAWISAFIAFLTFTFVLFFRKFKFRGILIVLASIVLVSLPLLREYSIKSSPFRAQVKHYFHYRLDSFDSHFLLLQGAVEIFEEKPLFGGGYGSFFEHFSKTKVSSEYFSRDPAGLNTRVPAHTIWGELLSESGIFGLVSFLLFVTISILILIFLSLNDKRKEVMLLSAAMASSIIGLMVAGVFYSYNSEFFWIILFLYSLYGISLYAADLSKVLKFFAGINKLPLFIILLIAGLLIFTNLGTNHLIPWDEAIYAKIAKNMHTSGEYFVQQWRPSVNWFEKPPLYMWMMSGLMSLIGASSWAARLPSAVFGFATVILVYIWGKEIFNKTAAFISSLSLLTTFHFLYYSRTSMLDITSTFFITLCLYLYWKHKRSNNLALIILAGISAGLAVMTKGVVGLLPMPIIALYEIYLTFFEKQKISSKTIISYIVLVFSSSAVFIPWHLEMYRRFGQSFIDSYLAYHVLQRATMEIEDKGRPFYWYFEVIKVSMRLWFIALLGAFPFAIYKVYKKSSRFILLVIWSVFVFTFFSISKSKLVWYIIPAYPAFSLLIGIFGERLLQFLMRRFSKLNNIVFKSLSLFLLIVVILLYLFLNKELVYTSDLTGAQAKLLQHKDSYFGLETTVYADTIDLPLILFYSDGPFEQMDFGSLERKIMFAGYNQDVIFITKESRFRKYLEINPKLVLVQAQKEWVLGYAPSRYDIDKKTLDTIQSEINGIQIQIESRTNSGKVIPPEYYHQLQQLRNQEIYITDQIQRGLSTVKPDQE